VPRKPVVSQGATQISELSEMMLSVPQNYSKTKGRSRNNDQGSLKKKNLDEQSTTKLFK
jgi:hypothetical protein